MCLRALLLKMDSTSVATKQLSTILKTQNLMYKANFCVLPCSATSCLFFQFSQKKLRVTLPSFNLLVFFSLKMFESCHFLFLVVLLIIFNPASIFFGASVDATTAAIRWDNEQQLQQHWFKETIQVSRFVDAVLLKFVVLADGKLYVGLRKEAVKNILNRKKPFSAVWMNTRYYKTTHTSSLGKIANRIDFLKRFSYKCY